MRIFTSMTGLAAPAKRTILVLLAFASVLVGLQAEENKAALPLRPHMSFDILVEKGANYSRLAPVSRLGLAYDFALDQADICVGPTCAAGALFGQVLEVGIDASYAPFWSSSWKPSLGLSLSLDAGSTIYFTKSGAASAPPAAMGYAGLVLRPLSFKGDSGWGFSFLDTTAAMGFFDFPSGFRMDVSLLTIEWRPAR
jgi:hypothetical protein